VTHARLWLSHLVLLPATAQSSQRSHHLLREVACHFDIQRVAVNAAACCRLRTRIRLAGGYRRRKPRPGTSQ
jgi:hypothetical protein